MRLIRRVLVTGSRAWEGARAVVWLALDREMEECPDDHDLEIIHGGACGPDRYAQAWVDDYVATLDPTRFAGVSARRFDPDYRQYHATVAPLMRNQTMVDEKPYRCLAFHWGASTGTADCIQRALKANIETHIYRPGIAPHEIVTTLF